MRFVFNKAVVLSACVVFVLGFFLAACAPSTGRHSMGSAGSVRSKSAYKLTKGVHRTPGSRFSTYRDVEVPRSRQTGAAGPVFSDSSGSTQAKVPVLPQYAQQTRERETSALNDQIFSAANVSTDPSDYLLGSGDLIQVTVFESEELNTKARVSSRGYVTLPLLGEVEVKGLSAREAETRVEELYKERYLKNPHISVFVEEHMSQRITMVGQFKKPGTYDYLTKMRLIDVMSLAGGLSENAGRTAQIRRMERSGESGKQSQTFLVDLDKMLREGQQELNIEINGGDVIFVPEAGMVFVDGAVRKPGAFPIRRQTTVSEAISLAGGLAPYAKKKKITLVRHIGNGERKVMDLDLDDPAVQQMAVSDRDVVYAQVSSMARALHGFGLNFGIPGVASFGYRDPVR